MDLNGLDLTYPTDATGKTAAAELIERCASGGVTKDEMMDWFDQHKTRA